MGGQQLNPSLNADVSIKRYSLAEAPPRPARNIYGVRNYTKHEQTILNVALRANVCPRCGAAPGGACADTPDSTVHVVRIPVGFNAEKVLKAAKQQKQQQKHQKKTRRKR